MSQHSSAIPRRMSVDGACFNNDACMTNWRNNRKSCSNHALATALSCMTSTCVTSKCPSVQMLAGRRNGTAGLPRVHDPVRSGIAAVTETIRRFETPARASQANCRNCCRSPMSNRRKILLFRVVRRTSASRCTLLPKCGTMVRCGSQVHGRLVSARTRRRGRIWSTAARLTLLKQRAATPRAMCRSIAWVTAGFPMRRGA